MRTEGTNIDIAKFNNDLSRAMVKAGLAPIKASDERFSSDWVYYNAIALPNVDADTLKRAVEFAIKWVGRHSKYPAHKTCRRVWSNGKDIMEIGVAYMCTSMDP
jgi:hypothetical protein